MRDNFVNDIGDYAKYALLRSLCASEQESVRLGVIWYLTDRPERNGDGRKRVHLLQDGWTDLDPGLLEKMRQIESTVQSQAELNIRLIEDSGILPESTAYFSEAIPRGQTTGRQRATERVSWFARAQETVKRSNLVFLDPDNGLEVRSVPPTSPLSSKYATVAEINALLDDGAAVVLYQHGSRTPWKVQREQICTRIASANDRAVTIRSLRFGAFGTRAFFCVTTTLYMTTVIESGLERLRQRTVEWDKASYMHVE